MKILVIRYGAIGDVVLTTPIYRFIYHSLGIKCDVVLKERNSVLLQGNPYVRDLFFKEDDQLVTKLKNANYDLVIDLQRNPHSIILSKRLGVRTVRYDKLRWQHWKYLKFRKGKEELTQTIERYIMTVSRTLAITRDTRGLELFTKVKADPKYAGSIVIAVGGSKLTKQIPSELVTQILSYNDALNFTLIGGNDVVEEYSKINYSERINNLVGDTSLNESISIIANASLLITGDTGMMHIGAALQKKMVVIWGSTSPEMGFAPYYGHESEMYHSIYNGDLSCRPCSKYGKTRCPKGHMKCLSDLKVVEINRSIKTLLDAR